MSDQVKVPDIGDFTDVPVIEVLVSPGDTVAAEDPLIVLESDKASMDVPAPQGGTVDELLVEVGDKVSKGTPILTLTTDGQPKGPVPLDSDAESADTSEDKGTGPLDSGDDRADVVVIGSGPGGYTAAFRAADLGLKTVLVERYERLGGVCLNVGCIPSKALLHLARVLADAEEAAGQGISFGEPDVDLDGVRAFKDSAVKKLTDGLAGMAKTRGVEVVTGTAKFTGPHTLDVGGTEVAFEHAIIAVGSHAVPLPGVPDDPRIVDSTGALELPDVPERLLVIGGGIIGLEMATVHDALGSKVTVVEMLDQLIAGADPDVVKPLRKRIEKRYEAIHLETKVDEVRATDDGIVAVFGGSEETFDRVLVAVGRRPNGGAIGADAAGVEVDERGFIGVDEQMRTNVAHIFAIGDVVGEPMLAHKATHEAKVAAEVIAGENVAFDAKAIPSVAYTDPEVAWMGLTETQAKADGTEVETAVFPWAASGRALGMGRPEGMTKLVLEPGTNRLLGAGIVGVNAGELIAELVHALEMGADAEDLGLTVHPHPTLSESIGMAAEVGLGTITDLPPKRRKARR
ncbi:MAG TPA: dihydrolipoyl dehydrogenase [Solirubrobacteraceae bacterium]|nr:dihydrolipoyl dehydrogenase [Solirubrobacteraceae bacterium]